MFRYPFLLLFGFFQIRSPPYLQNSEVIYKQPLSYTFIHSLYQILFISFQTSDVYMHDDEDDSDEDDNLSKVNFKLSCEFIPSVNIIYRLSPKMILIQMTLLM